MFYTTGTTTWQAVGDANEFESAESWLYVERASQPYEKSEPIVDCGVHYIDVMCQMTRSNPVQVSAIGARLTEEIPEGNYKIMAS
jgi:predicted dehydrogenase